MLILVKLGICYKMRIQVLVQMFELLWAPNFLKGWAGIKRTFLHAIGPGLRERKSMLNPGPPISINTRAQRFFGMRSGRD